MELLDLPLELFQSIMDRVVWTGLKQSMHARVVCSKYTLDIPGAPWEVRNLVF
jgi:hypothetical protein